jgi:preprotein translocase subunit SecA
MGKIFHFLGLTVGVNCRTWSREEARRLRRRHHLRHQQRVRLRLPARQHGDASRGALPARLHYAIVDEVDSILIDEARTPLIISGQAEDRTELYQRMNQVAPLLTRQKEEKKPDQPEPPGDFFVDEKNHQILLSEGRPPEGRGDPDARRPAARGREPVRAGLHQSRASALRALRAHHLFHRDQHYVVQEDEVIIVDEFTGRLMQGRRWSTACTRRWKPRRRCRSRTRTRRSPRSPSRTTSACTASSPA